MFITGPQVIKAVTGETVYRGTGEPWPTTGPAGSPFMADDEAECLQQVKTLLSYLPANNMEDPPTAEPVEPGFEREELVGIVPENPNRSYNVKDVILRVVDGGSFFEVHRHFAENAVVGFARLGGAPVGIIANQPQVKAGCLDIDSSDKISRFVRFCDCFNLPLVTLVDVPGYLPGVEQEWGYYPPWGQGPLCLLRGYRPPDIGYFAESLAGSLHCHEFPLPGRRLLPGLAYCGDSGNGPGGSKYCQPPGYRGSRR